MKTLKFHIAKERVSVKEKQELLAAFQRILYARQDDVYIRMEEAFLALASPKLSSYYKAWSVTNTQTARDYDVSCGPDSNRLICSCYVNCCFGLPCRHIIAVHHRNGEPLFNIVDVMPRWLR